MTMQWVRLHYVEDESFAAATFATTADSIDLPRYVAFDGTVEWEHERTGKAFAEECFARFNRGSGREHPNLDGNGIRSLSVGDVVEISEPGASQWWLCRGAGWQAIEGVRSKTNEGSK